MKAIASINSHTQVCAVIGYPLGHTLSPAIHNAAYDALGLDFVYVAFPVKEAAAALTAVRHLDNLRGLSVTIPHKTSILDQVDELSDLDRCIGSINTVVKEDGRLRGVGTDGPGAIKALRDSGIDLAGRKVLILGAGGAARAIAFTLGRQASPAGIALVDLAPGVLERLAADLRVGVDVPIEADLSTPAVIARRAEAADVIIHCTPVGMHPHTEGSLVDPDCLRADQIVFDVVYNPLRTRLLRDAEAKGCRTIVGAEMFVNQAALQFEAFTGHPAPVEVMRRVVLDHLTP
jgi:shikimate dehydrogenase